MTANANDVATTDSTEKVRTHFAVLPRAEMKDGSAMIVTCSCRFPMVIACTNMAST